MGIRDREKFFPAPFDPLPSGVGLTLGTMTISARVIGVAEITATGALIDMPAESGGAAALDRSQNLQMLDGHPLAAVFDELLSRCTDDIGHLQGWPIHLGFSAWVGCFLSS